MESELVCRALRTYKRQVSVLACVFTLEELLKKVAEHQPKVTVISSTLDGEAHVGLKALRKLRALGMITRPIMLVDNSTPEMVTDVFSAGAKGIVSYEDSFEVLYKCILSVCAGQVWVNTQELQWVVKSLATREPVRVVNAAGISPLTDREEQIVRLLTEGIPSREVASTLGLSSHTVKNHLFHIYHKLGVSSRCELILHALSSRQHVAPA
jgi:DNA-binding NarL/FixJ family response regulator